MNKILSTLVLSVSALMATTAVMAAPDYRHDDRRYHQNYQHQNHQHHNSHWNDHHHNNKWENDRYNKRVNPSRDWRVGQTLPRAYDSSRYKVSDREARRLPNTGRYQQWYKINGDYVLVNDRTDRIIRIRNG